MSDHTKEPWIQNHDDVCAGQPFNVLATCSWDGAGDTEFDGKANARRIVACVNACAEIPTEDLEESSMNILQYMEDQYAEKLELLQQQRDQLIGLVNLAYRKKQAEFLDLVTKYAGTRFENDPAYIAAKEWIEKADKLIGVKS